MSISLASCCLCPDPSDKDSMPVALNDLSDLYLSMDDQELPPFACIQDVKTKKKLFFGYTLNLVREHNQKINETREVVHALKEKLLQAEPETHTTEETVLRPSVPQFEKVFNEDEIQWLRKLAEIHRVPHSHLNEHFFDSLLLSLDIVPPSMALAQAANESAWGTSRFAVEANNLFGQWCFSPGCGVVPQLRPEGATYEVKLFNTPSESVGQYMLNINRNNSYEKVRNIRHSYRQQDQVIPGSSVVGGLENYSARGHDYIEELRHMIGYNDLSQWDNPENPYPDISHLEIPNC